MKHYLIAALISGALSLAMITGMASQAVSTEQVKVVYVAMHGGGR